MIEFFVQGTPAPAGSKRAFVIKSGGFYTGRAIVTDANKKSKPWQQEIKQAAFASYLGSPLDGPLRVTFTFRLLRPKGHYGSGKNAHIIKDSAPAWPVVKPDVLKLSRGAEDALTSILWHDDAQIVQEILVKEYVGQAALTGVQIKVEKL